MAVSRSEVNPTTLGTSNVAAVIPKISPGSSRPGRTDALVAAVTVYGTYADKVIVNELTVGVADVTMPTADAAIADVVFVMIVGCVSFANTLTTISPVLAGAAPAMLYTTVLDKPLLVWNLNAAPDNGAELKADAKFNETANELTDDANELA